MDINLSTTVNDLLTEYPELQQVLIALDPKFEKLKNPILRKSIARVATLEQASAIANIPPTDFINHLRKAMNQSPIASSNSNPDSSSDS